MTNDELKKLENKLWDTANSLRAYGGIKASDYAVPVLGLIFLRFADNKYSHAEPEINRIFEQDRGSRLERPIDKVAIEKCGFYLPPHARYDYLLNLPGQVKAAQAIKAAMEGIEQYLDDQLQGVLPKDPYFDIEHKKDTILPQLLKVFSDIPKDADIDVFGKIYEYFLGKFALSEGQKGGEFFTPTAVVRFIVEVIEPFQGKIFDPACGSGGMFVQSANFLKKVNLDRDKIYVEGQEFMGETARLAKMNLLVNNLRGEIAEVNSYENDHFHSMGKYDYVMANPPFNVKGLKESTVKNDERFTHYGLPKPKSGNKKQDKITDANYLWISLFATSLNANGRAGFVMANSAADARNNEYEIRRKMVDAGIVDCMVTIPSNMFYTVTLPATLWFLERGKKGTEREKKILFIDARTTFRQLDQAHRDWSEEQIQNLAVIARLYRGETGRYLELVGGYIRRAIAALQGVNEVVEQYRELHNRLLEDLRGYAKESATKRKPVEQAKIQETGVEGEMAGLQPIPSCTFPDCAEVSAFDPRRLDNAAQREFAAGLAKVMDGYESIAVTLKDSHNRLSTIYKQTGKVLRLKQDKRWSELGLIGADRPLQEAFDRVCFDDEVKEERGVLDWPRYWSRNIEWLQSRFPEARYADVLGLCKVADHQEVAGEQDYSLNPGRYVGVVIEGQDITDSEFKTLIENKIRQFELLTLKSKQLEEEISITSCKLFDR